MTAAPNDLYHILSAVVFIRYPGSAAKEASEQIVADCNGSLPLGERERKLSAMQALADGSSHLPAPSRPAGLAGSTPTDDVALVAYLRALESGKAEDEALKVGAAVLRAMAATAADIGQCALSSQYHQNLMVKVKVATFVIRVCDTAVTGLFPFVICHPFSLRLRVGVGAENGTAMIVMA